MGVLLTFTLGYWCNWWQLAAAITLLVIPFILGMAAVPESPHWYFSKGVDSATYLWLNHLPLELASSPNIDDRIKEL